MFGKGSIVASEEVVKRYGPPPRGGTISPIHTDPSAATPALRTARRPGAPGGGTGDSRPPATPAITPRGYVVLVKDRVVVVDLTARDGLKSGSILSFRRPTVQLTHPITGQPLGELDEQIGTARVVELRERFSVAEIEELRPGVELEPKDRVVPQPE
jgi:hypothetical protein